MTYGWQVVWSLIIPLAGIGLISFLVLLRVCLRGETIRIVSRHKGDGSE